LIIYTKSSNSWYKSVQKIIMNSDDSEIINFIKESVQIITSEFISINLINPDDFYIGRNMCIINVRQNIYQHMPIISKKIYDNIYDLKKTIMGYGSEYIALDVQQNFINFMLKKIDITSFVTQELMNIMQEVNIIEHTNKRPREFEGIEFNPLKRIKH